MSRTVTADPDKRNGRLHMKRAAGEAEARSISATWRISEETAHGFKSFIIEK